jgi:hypothetical protein
MTPKMAPLAPIWGMRLSGLKAYCASAAAAPQSREKVFDVGAEDP